MEDISIVLAAGFLGSGKTTYMLREAAKAVENGKRCAVIVNEASEDGIDNIEYRRRGFSVSEIFGGCICCSLTVSLNEALHELVENFAVDTIFIEPSGVADVTAIIEDMLNQGIKRTQITVVALLDTARVEMLTDVLAPLTSAIIKCADRVELTKTDIASPQQLAAAIRFVSQCGRGEELDFSGAELAACFTAHARKITLSGCRDISEYTETARGIVSSYAEAVAGQPNILIGHIKALLDYQNGYVKFSCFDSDHGVQTTEHAGERETHDDCVTLSLNTIVSGISESALDRLLLQIASERGASLSPEAHEHHHQHE